MTPTQRTSPYRILIVDDETGIRNVLTVSLTDWGHTVYGASDGKQALAQYDEHHPDIVLTDIKMPVMDGLALLGRIKAKDPEAEVLMMTGHGDIDLAIESLKLDATDFITKPIHDDALQIAIKRASDRMSMRRQLRQYTENLEQMVADQTEQLLQAERLTAIGQTVAGLSHAIKNIAGGLTGGAYVLEKGIELSHPEYLTRGWTMVKGNVDKIKGLSLDLLEYAKPSPIRYHSGNPTWPAAEVVELLQNRADEIGIVLTLEAPNETDLIYLDRESIHRCLLNLVSNALDAGEADGCPNKPCHVTVTVTPVPDWGVEYRVTDDCQGMDATVRENIFRQFFTTKGTNGTGIGLMLTKKLVDDLGGHIEVETESGVGSTFTMRIPQGKKSWKRRF